MEVHFSPEKEARVQDLAHRTGREPAAIVEEAVDHLLEYETHFVQAVEQGRASARRHELLEHDEVVERVEKMFRS